MSNEAFEKFKTSINDKLSRYSEFTRHNIVGLLELTWQASQADQTDQAEYIALLELNNKFKDEALAHPVVKDYLTVQESLTSLDEIFADEMFRLNRNVVPLPNNLIHEIAQRNYHPELGINPIEFTRDLEHAHGIK